MKRLFLFIILFTFHAMLLAKAESWSGTGFALKDKYVITNHHVVDGANTLLVRGIRGDFTKTYNSVVVATDAIHDLALIRIEDSRFSGFGDIPYTIKSTLSEVGEEIFVLGYPLLSSMGDEIKLTTGIISSRSGYQGNISVYQISAPVQPGNSGGPLFDLNGDVVGVVNAKHRQADNAGYAIKSPYIHLFIQNCMLTDILPTNRGMIGSSLVDMTKAIKPFVFTVHCEGYARGYTSDKRILRKPEIPHRDGQVYSIGDVVVKDGVVGIVFEVDKTGKHGKLLSVNETVCDWSNAINWCANLGQGWYLPSQEELQSVYSHKDTIYDTITRNGYNGISSYYWSNAAYIELYAWYVNLRRGTTYYRYKTAKDHVRAVSAF